ncbi:MAG: heme biosynthesis HemY N-terminal domain-containing protein [Pseudomonadales bacterium]
MKRLFILILLVLVAGYWVADLIAEDAGYVLLSYKNTTLETSVWVGLVLLLAAVVVVYFGIWLFIRLLGSRDTVRRWTYNFKHKRSVSKTTQGLMDLVEGNWKEAQKKLSQAAPQSETPLVNYLSAARAAAAGGDPNGSELFLKKAHESTPGAGLAIGITKAEIQVQQNQFEQARATLLVLRQDYPRNKHVAQLLKQVYMELEDWEALQELMPLLHKLRIVTDSKLDEIEYSTVLKVLERAAREQDDRSERDRAHDLQKAWQRVPARVKREEDVAAAYAELMLGLNQPEPAEQALREALEQVWSEKLAEEYGLLAVKDYQGQLKTAESWQRKHNDSAALKLTLGRLCLRNRIWGRAREYFMESLALKETAQAHAELARLLKHLGEHKACQEHMQKGFDLVAVGLPHLPLPDEQHTQLAQMAAQS